MSIELSIAIIFRDEIRCLERCLKSLQPLKERLSCEIVMADTGSTDGSRAVAERYADAVFDFPWVDDFSAARNAVLDRCSGAWALSMDCDEWLDADVDAFVSALRKSERDKNAVGGVVRIRNYTDRAMDQFEDSSAPRLLRMSAKPRYHGRIHEAPVFSEAGETVSLPEILLHHDGYIMLNDASDAGRKKVDRNTAMLRREVQREPESLLRLMQFIESGRNAPDYFDMLFRAVELTKGKKEGWETYGPVILRYALFSLDNAEDSGWDGCRRTAFEMFPDSPFILLDGNFACQQRMYLRKEYSACVSCAKAYLDARARFLNDARGLLRANEISPLKTCDDRYEALARINLSDSCLRLGQPEHAISALDAMPWAALNEEGIEQALLLLLRIFAKSGLDVSRITAAFWDGVCGEPQAKAAFLKAGRAICDSEEVRIDGKAQDLLGKRPSDMFSSLRGNCILGDAAALLRCRSAEEADAVFRDTAQITELPTRAFLHALKLGAEFPIPGKNLASEEAVLLAQRLRVDKAFLREAAIFAADAAQSAQDILWASALGFSALEANDWASDEDPAALIFAFARAESAFLAICYTKETLESPEYLPLYHRSALHLVNALSALFPAAVSAAFVPSVRFDTRGALAELRLAVEAAPAQKPIVDKILDMIL